MIPAIAISLLLIAVQVCVVPGYDMADVASWLIGGVGIVGIGYVCLRRDFGALTAVLGLPIVYMVLISLQRWVPGFTEFQIAWYVAGWGIVALAARGNVRVIMWALLAGVVVQAAIQHFSLIPWAQHFPDAKDDIWGTFRHRIRYSTVIYAGLIAAWWLFSESRGVWKWIALAVGALALFEIWRANSQTIQVFAAVTFVAFLVKEIHWKVGVIVGSVGLLAVLLFGGAEWGVDNLLSMNGRVGIWWSCIKSDLSPWWKAIIGHGSGAWTLDCGKIGWEMLRHPHNELLHMAYEYGFLAIWWTVGIALLAVWCAPGEVLKLGTLFVLCSMLTNSASTYPEQFLLSCIFIGVGLAEIIQAVDGSRCGVDSGDTVRVSVVEEGPGGHGGVPCISS